MGGERARQPRKVHKSFFSLLREPDRNYVKLERENERDRQDAAGGQQQRKGAARPGERGEETMT